MGRVGARSSPPPGPQPPSPSITSLGKYLFFLFPPGSCLLLPVPSQLQSCRGWIQFSRPSGDLGVSGLPTHFPLGSGSSEASSSPQSFTSLLLCHLSLLSHFLPPLILVSLTSSLPWTQPLGAFLLPPFYPPYFLHPFLPPILLPFSPFPFLFHLLLLAFLLPDHLLHPLTLSSWF